MATYDVKQIALPGGDIANLKDGNAIHKSDTSGFVKNDGSIDQNTYQIAQEGKGLSTNDYTTAEKDKVATIDDKADKVTSATNGNLAGLNGSGNLTDSGWNGSKTTTSVSGNPISITGLKSNQLAINPIITLEPIQSGTGTPSPDNIREISGYDKIEVLSCGRNLIEGKLTGYTITSSGNVYANAGNDLQYAKVVKGATYTISEQSQYVYSFFTEEPTTTSTSYNGERVVESNYSFIAPISGYVAVRTTTGTSAQIEAGSTQHTIKPYNKATSISESLGQTVYWGRLNVRTGEFEVLGKIIRLNSLQWGYVNGYFNVSIGLPADCVTVAILHGYKCFSSKYNAVQKGYLSMQSGELVLGDAGWSSVVRLIVKDSRFTDVTSFTNSLTNDDTLVYPLATPFTIQLTPHEISLLKDYAYVSTNGTNIALDYHNGELASLADVAQLGETVNELGFNFITFEVPVAGTTTGSRKWADISVPSIIDENKYIPVNLIEQSPWDEHVTYSISYTNAGQLSIHMHSDETNHTVPANNKPLLVLCIPKNKVTP